MEKLLYTLHYYEHNLNSHNVRRRIDWTQLILFKKLHSELSIVLLFTQYLKFHVNRPLFLSLVS